MLPEDINQTIIMTIEHYNSINSIVDFSRFSSLLEVAFALNISYKLIPDIMERVGQQKVKKIETNQITAWEAEIKDLKSDPDTNKDRIISLNGNITSIDNEADKKTKKLKVSQFFHSWVAPTAVIITIVILFFGSLGYCPLENFDNKTTIQFWTIIALLLPNIVAIIFQLLHWNEIEEKLNYLIETLKKQHIDNKS
jgi:hypothetical protein